MQPAPSANNIQFLAGGGEMGALTRNKNWEDTVLGIPEQWPQSLRTTLSIIINSRFPMFLFWGKELTCFYNDAYRPSLGMEGKHPTILGQPAEDAWPEIWGFIKPLIDKVLTSKEAIWFEDQLLPIYRNGKMEDVYWTFSYSPVNDESGLPAGVFVTCYESTGKVSALKEVKERESQLSFTIDAAELGTWDLDPATNRFTGNDRLKEWFGLSPDGEIELPLALSRIVKKDREAVIEAIQTALKLGTDNNYNIEYTIHNPVNKRERIVLAKGKALFNEDGIAYKFSGTMQDVTEQVQARQRVDEVVQQLSDTAQHLNLALGAGKLGSYVLDMETGNIICTDQCKENFGRKIDGIRNYSELKDMVLPEDMAPMKMALAKAFKEHTNYNSEYRIRWADESIHWIRAAGLPVYDENDKPVKIVGVTADITEQKQFEEALGRQVQERTLELEQKNADLRYMNKELESFAYVSSHDLQEPLRKIQTFASRILEKEMGNLSDSGKDYFGRMQAAAKRMQTLIEDLLAYSRTNNLERIFKQVDVKSIVAEVCEDFKEQLQAKGAVINVFDTYKINIIPFQFRQLMQNLIGNSLKFATAGKAPEITINCGAATPAAYPAAGLLNGRSYSHISISDNGIGFEPEYSSKIFEVFQRLNPAADYQGTGIGLAIVKKIVDNHNGFITAAGVLNKGATFDIYLPL